MSDFAQPSGKWLYTGHPETGKDSRHLVTLEEQGMVWVGIRAAHSTYGLWMNNGEPERARVIAYMRLPEPAPGRWARGLLIGAEPQTGTKLEPESTAK